jgi:hypothetical protein
MMTRREFRHALLPQVVPQPDTSPKLPIAEIQLEDADLREVAREADRAIKQAAWLRELPLGGVAPGFVFRAT